MYSAKQIADYVVGYGMENNISISNLKLQKLLYFIWIDYYKATNQFLFEENFSAWKFGPVVPEVYYEYCAYGCFPIYKKLCGYSDAIDKDVQKIINKTILKLKNEYVSQLVEKTHGEGKPWKKNFSEGMRNDIPFDDIIEMECQRT